MAGVYHIEDQLRIRHPELEIQSCSGGGGRVDLGILGRTEQVWVSDNTDAFARLAIQEGFSLAYPARIMESWVTAEYNELTRRSAPLGMRFDVAMRGALGIGSDLTALSQEELAEHAAGSFRPAVPLRGLLPGATYAIFDRHNEEIGRLSGYHLMTLGPPQETDEHPRYSRTLHLKQV